MTSELVERVPRSFAFGPFVLIPERQLLLQADAPVRIGGRAMDILTALVERPGELLSKRELMARVWPNVIVEEGNLKVNMAALRRVLGDGVGTAQYIATATGRGYRFIAPVQIGDFSGLGLPSPEAATRGHNLPIATTRVFGRTDVMEAIRRDLNASRLVSIVGSGGIGKTTVALTVAELALGSTRDGVWLVDLAPLEEPALVPNAIAMAIGLAAPSAEALAILCENLRAREMLIVLDSCEHVIEAAAFCADRILAAAPGIKILVTSREPLCIKGERIRRLTGLGTPPALPLLNAEQALVFPAVQLFVDRAKDGLESFTLGDTEAPSAAEICRRLDGLALAIELAATRVHAFGIEGLLNQLENRLQLLSGRRAGPARHRTLRATLDWSYGLLSQVEADLLRAVSVFSSVFDLDGAQAVSNLVPHEMIDALAQLAAKSLLAVDVNADRVAYRLLETTRAYCLEQLDVSGEAEAIRHRHAEYVCTVLERATAEWAKRPDHEWAGDYGRFLDDLRGALAWATRESGSRSLRIRLTVAGLLLWNHYSLTGECCVQVSRTLDELDAAGLAGSKVDMQLKVWLGGSTMFAQGVQPEAMEAMRQGRDIAVRIGDTDCHLRCLRTIGIFQHFIGDHVSGQRTTADFVALAAAAAPSATLEAETHVGISEFFLGQLQNARQRLERVRDLDERDMRKTQPFRFLSDRTVDTGAVLTAVEWLTGSPDAALRTAEATLQRAVGIGHHISQNSAAAAACPVFYWTGRHKALGQSVDLLHETGARHGIMVRRPTELFYRAALLCAQGEPDKAIEGIEQALAEFRAANHLARMPYYLSVLSDALAACGRLDKANAMIQTAHDVVMANREEWCLPEVLRVHAAILIADGRPLEAEARLLDAVAVAAKLGALSWQLRAATDLARLWSGTLRKEKAQALLAPVYATFSEGFGTPDLVAAHDLLAAMSAWEGISNR